VLDKVLTKSKTISLSERYIEKCTTKNCPARKEGQKLE
jgi:hypothetical protein